MSDRQARPEILIIDDNPAIVRLLTDSLEEAGYEVATVSAPNAVALASATQPRLILLDVMMPGLAGPEVCRQLRAAPQTAKLPIVLVTALPPATLTVQLRDCPYDDVLAKPFALEDLIAIATRYVGPRPAYQQY